MRTVPTNDGPNDISSAAGCHMHARNVTGAFAGVAWTREAPLNTVTSSTHAAAVRQHRRVVRVPIMERRCLTRARLSMRKPFATVIALPPQNGRSEPEQAHGRT